MDLEQCLTYDLEECKVAVEDVVKVDLGVDPFVVAVSYALWLIAHYVVTQLRAVCIHTLVELASKQLHAGNAAADIPRLNNIILWLTRIKGFFFSLYVMYQNVIISRTFSATFVLQISV